MVAYVPDLMDRSRIAASAARVGRPLVVASTPAELVSLSATAGATFVVDLSRANATGALAALPPDRTVGFAGHLERELLAEAKEASGARVLARSRLFATLDELLR